MTPTANTKILARIHPKNNPRGLNIYNPFFEAAGVDAQYLLIPTTAGLSDVASSMVKLGVVGVNTGGYETDPDFAKVIAKKDISCERMGRIAYLKLENGEYKAYYKLGLALLQVLSAKFCLENKNIVIVGAGTLVKGLLYAIQDQGVAPASITLVNRTVAKAQALQQIFPKVKKVIALNALDTASGDILINCTDIGDAVTDTFFTVEILKKYSGIGDVCFKVANPNIKQLSETLQIPFVNGLDFFTQQGKIFIDDVLGINADFSLLRSCVVKGLAEQV